ncbi:MAG: hypothetical protein JWQ11_2538 [Rhizobacter sp.]|nr:hypothetical protein [Rhizobacter sp.]
MTSSLTLPNASAVVHANAARIANQIASQYALAGSPPRQLSVGQPAPFVRFNATSAHVAYSHAAVPARFAYQVTPPLSRPTDHADRNRKITFAINGKTVEYTAPYASARPHRASDPLPHVQAWAKQMVQNWPQCVEGKVETVGSRDSHRHAAKTYDVKKVDGGLRISAFHRRHSDLEIFPDGRIYLGSREVTEKSSDVVLQRVASRLNAAECLSASYSRAVNDAPKHISTQTEAPKQVDVQIQVGQPQLDSLPKK